MLEDSNNPRLRLTDGSGNETAFGQRERCHRQERLDAWEKRASDVFLGDGYGSWVWLIIRLVAIAVFLGCISLYLPTWASGPLYALFLVYAAFTVMKKSWKLIFLCLALYGGYRACSTLTPARSSSVSSPTAKERTLVKHPISEAGDPIHDQTYNVGVAGLNDSCITLSSVEIVRHSFSPYSMESGVLAPIEIYRSGDQNSSMKSTQCR